MPSPYPPAVALVRAARPQKQTTDDRGVHLVTLSKWTKQDDIDRGDLLGVPSNESTELRAARRRIRELENELAVVRQAATSLGENKPRAKGSTR